MRTILLFNFLVLIFLSSCKEQNDITGYISLANKNKTQYIELHLRNNTATYYFLDTETLWAGLKMNFTSQGRKNTTDGRNIGDLFDSDLLELLQNPSVDTLKVEETSLFNCDKDKVKIAVFYSLIILDPNTEITINIPWTPIIIDDPEPKSIYWEYTPNSDDDNYKYCGLLKTEYFKKYLRYDNTFKIYLKQ